MVLRFLRFPSIFGEFLCFFSFWNFEVFEVPPKPLKNNVAHIDERDLNKYEGLDLGRERTTD